MRWRSVLLAAAFVVPQPGPAEAADGDMHGLVARMAAWVVGKTGYGAAPPPEVAIVDQSVLRELCYPGCDDDDLPTVLGLYDPRVGSIFLDAAFDGGSTTDRGTLLHEVVHHIQMFNEADETARCHGELEGEALHLQLRWLSEVEGVADPMALLGIDEFTLRILGSCAVDY